MSLLSRSELRRFPRAIPIPSHPVEVQLMGDGFLDVLHAANVSEGGLAIDVEHGFSGCDISHSVELIIKLPVGPAFKARGIVRHAADKKHLKRFGIELTVLDDKFRRLLANYVEHLLQRGRGVG